MATCTVSKHTPKWPTVDNLTSLAPFLKLKNTDEYEKKNYVLQWKSGVSTANILVRSQLGPQPYWKTGAELEGFHHSHPLVSQLIHISTRLYVLSQFEMGDAQKIVLNFVPTWKKA